MKILMASSEATPFIKSGGLADVAGSLASALCARKEDCRVVLPLYEDIPKELRDDMTYMTAFNVPLGWRNQYCGLFTAKSGGVTYYFLDNQYYFKRRGLYGFFDDAERFAFFSKAILEMLPFVDFTPDVIHCNDWQTALVPVYLNLFYRNINFYKNMKTLFTIHNIQYQGTFDRKTITDVCGIPQESEHILDYYGDANFMKGAIEEANALTTVSPNYAKEILDPWFSHGLDPLLREKQYKVSGILNGINYDEYSPSTDTMIVKKYTVKSTLGKAACKAALQKELGLPVAPNTLLMSMVTRLTKHKGIDLVQQVLHRMLEPIQFVLLGSGDWYYENFFRRMQEQYPDKVSVTLGFREDLAHRIYSGSDAFLMPSKSEPCGLSQMIALSYGTIPIVRLTGGLSDTIRDIADPGGNGYTFQTYYAEDMLSAVGRSVADYKNKRKWSSYVKRTMACDFSWKKPAAAYSALYRKL